MALTCHCCNKNVIEIETVCCYVCNNLFSTSCVNLTDKDTRVLRSKKNIKWTCTTCCSVEVPNLIHNLTALVTSLQNDITELKSKLSSRPSDVNPNLTFTFEEVVHEVEERRRKEKNLVLFNLEDTESIEADKAAVLDLLQHMQVDTIQPNNIKLHRIGKNHVAGKRRPMKLVLESVEDVQLLLRKAKKLRTFKGPSKLFLSRDMTNREIEAKNKIISDYRRRREHDNNIALRYVNGMPRIVSKN